ncbi:hypothetical protein [Acinetobacter tandoii]
MAGGSQIIINKDGIKIITPAKFEAKAGQHLFNSGANVTVDLPKLPMWTPHEEFFVVHDENGKVIANQHYIMTGENGIKVEGYTDEAGRTKVFKSMNPEKVKIELLERHDSQYHNFEDDHYG